MCVCVCARSCACALERERERERERARQGCDMLGLKNQVFEVVSRVVMGESIDKIVKEITKDSNGT